MAGAADVALHVYVHPDAGVPADVVVAGAEGPCAVDRARLVCPARGDVRFSWPDGPFSLTGDAVLAPGSSGTAFVLARDDLRESERARLADPDAEVVRALFVRTGDAEPPPPSPGMLADLVALVDHPDVHVRRAVVEALHPWLWRATTGPLPADAPTPVPAHAVVALAADPDPGVRRRTARLLGDVRPGLLGAEAGAALLALTRDPVRGVRRAAFAALAEAPRGGLVAPEVAWERALDGVDAPGPPGRTAANALGRLERDLTPSDTVVPREAVERVLAHHPERAWNVWWRWRTHVPFERAWVDVLLTRTLGLHRGLLRHWAHTRPAELAPALVAWREGSPDPERLDTVRAWLDDVAHPEVRAALDLDRSGANSLAPL